MKQKIDKMFFFLCLTRQDIKVKFHFAVIAGNRWVCWKENNANAVVVGVVVVLML